MFKANQENFLKVYFSGLSVLSTPYVMDEWIGEWPCSSSGCIIFLISPKTHHQYLKFIEFFEKNKPLLVELR